MLQTTTITQKWQMTLPKKIRDSLGLEKPGRFLLEVVDPKEKLIKIKKEPNILDLAGSLPAKNKEGKRLDVVKIRDYMEEGYTRV